MGYSCKILADSVSPHGARLTTFEVTFPRIVLAEFNTHRMLSRNSASSRAIPVEKRIAMSPFEHVATPDPAVVIDGDVYPAFPSNFRGWFQLRKGFANEEDFGKVLAEREAES